eukprot:scaffold25148_cov72-Cyclotella_meneghiniana.AAC.3
MSARDNELNVNSEQSLYGHLSELPMQENALTSFVQLQIMSRRMRVLLAAAAAAARRPCALLSLHCVCHLTSRGKEY